MARITQYQSKAEIRPLHGSFKERTTPDKWLPTDWLNLGNPIAKAGALAVLAATTALAFVPVVSQAPLPETVTVDKWHQLTEQPSFTKRTQYLANGYFAPDRQQVPDFDSWAPQPNQPQFDLRRTQYLDPASFAPERQPQPRLDSWFQQASEPVRVKLKKLEHLGETDLQLTTNQEPERVSVDKFDPGTQQPRFDIRRQQYTYDWTAYDSQPFPNTVYADRWWQQPNQPQFDVRHNQYLYPSYFGPERQPDVRVSSWWQQASEPIRLGPAKTIEWQGVSVLGVPPAEDVEEVTPDRWQPNTNVPQFDAKRLQYTYPFSFAPDRQPQPRLDSWFQPTSEPVRLRDSRIQRLGASELDLTPAEDVERPSADKWHPEIGQPLFDRKRTQYTYEFSFFNPKPFPSPIFADKWHPEQNQPIFPRDRRVQVFGDSELQLASFRERTTPDKWQPAIEQPLFARARNQYLYPAFFGPERPTTAIEVVTLDKWFQQASEPLRRRTAALPLEFGFIRALESITPDKWLQPTAEPVRLTASYRHLFDSALQPGNGARERVSADKWHPLPNQPIFGIRRLQYLYPAYFGPDRQPVIGLDWFVQPNQPRFDVARRQYLDPPVGFAPRRQPDVAVDTWWLLGNQPIFDVARKQYLYPAFFSPERQPDVPVTSWWQQPNQPIFDVARLQTLDPNLFRFDFPLPRLFNPGYVRSVLAENAIDVTTQGGQVKLALFQSDVALVLTRIATTTKTSEGSISITIEPLS